MDMTQFFVKLQFLLIYFDDKVTLSQRLCQHISHSQAVFGVLKESNIFLNLKTFVFLKKKIGYLVDAIRPGGLEDAKNTTDSTGDLMGPTT